MKRRRHSEQEVTISLTPLIDTVLVLLVIFMMTAPLMRRSIVVDVPEGKRQEVENNDNGIVVSLTEKNTIYINNIVVRYDQIGDVLKTLLKDCSGTIFVEVDKSVPSGTFIGLVDHLKECEGIERVVIATQPPSS